MRDLGSVISGAPAVIHHPVGATGRHNKIDIGHWWVIPLTDEEHKALHRGESPWLECGNQDWIDCDTRKEFEKAAFAYVYSQLRNELLLFPSVFDAIRGYHK